MDNTIPTNATTSIPVITYDGINLVRRNQTKFINNNLSFSVDTAKTIKSITDIPLSEEEYKVVLHFKNGGMLNQLTVNQLKLLSKSYHFTEQDIIALKDKPDFIEYLHQTGIMFFSSLPEIVKKNPIIALKAFAIGNYSFIKYIPQKLQTQEICDKAFIKSPQYFIYFNDEFKTIKMCQQYLKDSCDINFALIPQQFREDLQQTFIDKINSSSDIKVVGIELLPINILKENLNIIYKSCLYSSENLIKLDQRLVTKELLIKLAQQSISCIPEKYLDIDLVLVAIKYSNFDSNRNYSLEHQLKIIDKYFISDKEIIQQAVYQRLNLNKQQQLSFLYKYLAYDLLYHQAMVQNINLSLNMYKIFQALKIKYLLSDWIKRKGACLDEDKMILEYKNFPETFKEALPHDFFTQENHLKNKALVYKKNAFLKYLPNECKTLDMWLYLCINVNREYIKQMPESMVNEKILMQLVDEYVQDASRFDLEFTEFLFTHKLFNSSMQEKIFTHTLKCSGRSSMAFIDILKSSNIPQEFKDNIFENVMQGNIGYLQPNITELHAKTNPLQQQIPAIFATELLSSLYKLNGYNNLNSTELRDELKNYMAERQIETLSLDTEENNFTNAKVTGGRTIQVDIDENTAMFYKFRKPGERLSDFVKEGNFLEFLTENDAGKQFKQKLKSDICVLKKIVRIPLAKLPECADKCEDGLAKYIDENGTECVDVLVFSGSIDYLQYAHKPDIQNPENLFIKPEQGLLTAAHDLGVFMSQGIYHTTTLPLYHFKEDYRRWSNLNMILKGLPSFAIRGIFNGYLKLNQNKFSMTGKLEAWDSTATERPDYGYSGLRDLADYEFYGEIDSIATRKDSEVSLFKTIKQKAYAANAICECLTAIILLYARLHKFSEDYHYTNDTCRANTSEFIENMFTSFLTGILQNETINLQQFMQLTDADYQQWLDRATTELLYWTAQQPETKGENASKAENEDCFSSHVNKKQLPSALFDDTIVLQNIQYPKSFTTTEGNKKHNNLGMYNGTFPLLALTNFMILFNTRLNEYKI